MEKNRNKKVLIWINLSIGIFVLLLMVLLGYYFYRDIIELNWNETQNYIIEQISSTGSSGAFILILVQCFQVIVAFIPGEFIEIAAGAMFGPILGLILCLIGLNLGTIFIFWIVRKLGKSFLDELDRKGNYSKLEFLNNPIRAKVILFFFFLIPGTPKDLLIYPIPLTKIRLRDFLILSSIARIPAIISSTLIGSSIISSNYTVAIVISIITIIISAIGLIFNKQICNYIEEMMNSRKQRV